MAAYSAQNSEHAKHSLLKVYITGEQDVKKINNEGLFFDHLESHDGYIEAWLSEEEIANAQKIRRLYE
ncbi:MAG: hypothetical protein R2942_00940 [Ignavibacteria bacterium]